MNQHLVSQPCLSGETLGSIRGRVGVWFDLGFSSQTASEAFQRAV